MAAWRRSLPFILTGVFLFDLAKAIAIGGRGNWLMVAVLALVLAVNLWRGRHPAS